MIGRLAGLSAVRLVASTFAALAHGDAAWLIAEPRSTLAGTGYFHWWLAFGAPRREGKLACDARRHKHGRKPRPAQPLVVRIERD